MSLIGRLLPPLSSTSKPSLTIQISLCPQIPETISQKPNLKPKFLSKLLSLALAASLISPSHSFAVPSLNSQSSLLPSTTPFSQSKNLQIGLENGYVLDSFFSSGFSSFLLHTRAKCVQNSLACSICRGHEMFPPCCVLHFLVIACPLQTLTKFHTRLLCVD